MMQWIFRGIPLPLGSAVNLRSIVGLDNLVDLIVTCLTHPDAANQIFLVSDDADLSTSELLRKVGSALGKPVRLFPVPKIILILAATVLGRRNMAERLCDSLQVDIAKTKAILGWRPPASIDEGLQKVAAEFLANKKAVAIDKNLFCQDIFYETIV